MFTTVEVQKSPLGDLRIPAGNWHLFVLFEFSTNPAYAASPLSTGSGAMLKFTTRRPPHNDGAVLIGKILKD